MMSKESDTTEIDEIAMPILKQVLKKLKVSGLTQIVNTESIAIYKLTKEVVLVKGFLLKLYLKYIIVD